MAECAAETFSGVRMSSLPENQAAAADNGNNESKETPETRRRGNDPSGQPAPPQFYVDAEIVAFLRLQGVDDETIALIRPDDHKIVIHMGAVTLVFVDEPAAGELSELEMERAAATGCMTAVAPAGEVFDADWRKAKCRAARGWTDNFYPEDKGKMWRPNVADLRLRNDHIWLCPTDGEYNNDDGKQGPGDPPRKCSTAAHWMELLSLHAAPEPDGTEHVDDPSLDELDELDVFVVEDPDPEPGEKDGPEPGLVSGRAITPLLRRTPAAWAGQGMHPTDAVEVTDEGLRYHSLQAAAAGISHGPEMLLLSPYDTPTKKHLTDLLIGHDCPENPDNHCIGGACRACFRRQVPVELQGIGGGKHEIRCTHPDAPNRGRIGFVQMLHEQELTEITVYPFGSAAGQRGAA